MISRVSVLESLPDPKNSTYAVVKERIFRDFTGLLIQKYSILRQSYMDKITYLVESGIIEKIKNSFNQRIVPNDNEDVALSINHLLIWFQLWVGLLLIAVFIFSLEILMSKIAKVLMKKALKTFKQLLDSID
jgi:hypothetical protein